MAIFGRDKNRPERRKVENTIYTELLLAERRETGGKEVGVDRALELHKVAEQLTVQILPQYLNQRGNGATWLDNQIKTGVLFRSMIEPEQKAA